MDGEEIIEQIDQLLEDDRIDEGAALRLILANQIFLSKGINKVHECVSEVKETTEEGIHSLDARVQTIERRLERYPSIIWLWTNKRVSLITLVLILMLVYTILFGWVNISDVRHAILDRIGIPYDLGLGP